MPLADQRFLVLKDWLDSYLGSEYQCDLITGDASFRRYFRVTAGKDSYVVMDSPPNLSPIDSFVLIANAFAEQKINVPQIIKYDESLGLILLEDLGDCQLGQCLTPSNVKYWYQSALDILPHIISIPSATSIPLPLFDETFVYRELAIFSEWLVDKFLDGTNSGLIFDGWENIQQILVTNALAQPVGGMHRDFHCRNLMVKDEVLVVIDFQDAVVGPITYDAVSLLRDCYVRWDDNLVNELAEYHFQMLVKNQQLSAEVSFLQYKTWFDLMGLQRHLKAAGIFARLHLRDGKSGYLKDIPRTLSYIKDIAQAYPNLARLGHWVEQVLLPILEQALIEKGHSQ